MNHVIILAAGKGTRMHMNTPKCAIEILGKPMISYLLDTIEKINIDDVITVVGYNSQILTKIISKRSLIVKQKKQLGTADAVMAASSKVEEDNGYSIIINGDTPLINENILNDLINTHKKDKNDLTLTTITLDNPFGYGRIVRKGNNIVKIKEEKDATKKEKEIKEVNAGLYIVNNNLLFKALKKVDNNNAKNEYYLTDIVSILKNKKIGAYKSNEIYRLTGINDLYHLHEVEDFLRNEINKKLMYSGVYIENPNTVTIGPDVVINESTKIYQNTRILGNSRIGSNISIGPNTTIINSIIYDETNIIDSYISDSIIGTACQRGQYAHLRENSIIGSKNRIGNFVEFKKSSTKTNTKASHLAYVGDSIVGENVNFGCGSITVNFDSKEKHKTIIEDNVFIGCNSNLIAPIKISSNTFIAAGSTITDDLEDGDFAIARSKQITKKNYAKKYK